MKIKNIQVPFFRTLSDGSIKGTVVSLQGGNLVSQGGSLVSQGGTIVQGGSGVGGGQGIKLMSSGGQSFRGIY